MSDPRGALISLLVLVHAACAPAARPTGGPDVGALFGATASPAETGTLPAPAETETPSPDAGVTSPSAQPSCQSDDDCGYDPTSGRCGADPRWNKQPPVVDQGLVCYCDAPSRACALLRVEPVPCEGEASCAIRLDPRPHPVRASADHPYEKPRKCVAPMRSAPRRTDLFTTCERTNICTMNTRECAR